MSARLYNAVVIAVTLVWIVNFVARFAVADYQPPVQVDAIFMAIVGGAMALNRKDAYSKSSSSGDDR